MPATIIIKQVMPSAIRNALPFSLREFIDPSVKCQVSSVKVKQIKQFYVLRFLLYLKRNS